MVESTKDTPTEELKNHELVTSGLVNEIFEKIFIRATLTSEELVFSRINMPDTTVKDL